MYMLMLMLMHMHMYMYMYIFICHADKKLCPLGERESEICIISIASLVPNPGFPALLPDPCFSFGFILSIIPLLVLFVIIPHSFAIGELSIA